MGFIRFFTGCAFAIVGLRNAGFSASCDGKIQTPRINVLTIFQQCRVRDFSFTLPQFLLFCFLFLTLPAKAAETIGMIVGAGGIGDQSYNDMILMGLGKAQKEYNFQLIIEETDKKGAAGEAAVKRLLDQKVDVIVAAGSSLGKVIHPYGKANPETYFIIHDCPINDLKNVSSTHFAHQEGSYLTGLLAASMSKSGNIGFIGGIESEEILTFLKGYTQGAKSAVPTTKIRSLFLSPQDDLSGFERPSFAYKKAVEMYSEGTDIIFAVAGMSGNGVIQAAQHKGKLVIGVDADQDHMAKGTVLTSMVKRLDRATYLEISEIMQNRFTPGIKHYNLKNGGISLTPMKHTRHLISAEILEKLDLAEQDIIDGKINFQ